MAEPRRLRLPRPARVRRSHAERTAETRGRILDAVVASIAELGFQRTTAVEIARRAGVTWGAVQHHFGGKDGLLFAVLEESFDRFAARIDGLPSTGAPLDARVAAFVERAWEHFSGSLYRSTFEILLDYLRREDLTEDPGWQERMFRAWDSVWMRLFADAPISRARHRMLQHYTVSVLSGLAATLMLEGAGARLRTGELALLEHTLARGLGAVPESGRGGAA